MKQGWKIQTLGDVATFINGDRSTNYPSKKDYVIDGIPFVNAGNLIQSGLDLETLNLISQSKYDSLTQGKFVEGDILFCLRGTLGKHSIVQNGLNGAIASSLVIIRTKDGFNNKYISYFLDYKQPFIERLNNGAAQPNIPAKTMKGFPILLPPNEKQQQSIVEYLDSAFAQIDELKSNAEKQLAEARALFQSALTQAMQPKPGWQDFSFSQIIKLKSGDNLPAKSFVEGAYPVYGGNGIAGYHNQYNKEGGQIVIGRVGALCGNVRFIKSPFWLTDNGFEVILNKEQKMDLLFLTYLLNFCNLRQYARQAAQPVISNVSLKDIQLSIPPIKEQQTIVAQLDALSNRIRELDKISRKAAAECEALKQALLRQIFE